MTSVQTLPAELLVKILGHSSAREVQSSRAVCKHFRNAVDENEEAIGRQIQAREHARLTSRIDYYFHFDVDNVSFAESLRRWFARRPLASRDPGNYTTWSQAHMPFATRAAERLQQVRVHLDSQQDYREIAEPLHKLVEVMILLYFEHRKGIRYDHQYFPTKKSLVRFHTYWPALQPLVDQGMLDLSECWDAAVGAELSIMSPETADLSELAEDIRRILPITDLNLYKYPGVGPSLWDEEAGYQDFARTCRDALCSPRRVSDLFGTPPLPMGDGWVAYCVRSRWAYDLVEQALVTDVGFLKRAAIMEELCLC